MSRDDLALPGPNAPRTIWVFLLDVDAADIDRWAKPDPDTGDWPLPDVLGLSSLTPSDVEVFPEKQISEYGLTRYLTDANGMSVESVAEDAQTLASLRGVIVLVHSRGLSDQTGRFDPAHPARFVGRYSEAESLSVSAARPAHEATRGTMSGGATSGKSPRRMPWGIFVVAAIVIVVIAAVIMGLA